MGEAREILDDLLNSDDFQPAYDQRNFMCGPPLRGGIERALAAVATLETDLAAALVKIGDAEWLADEFYTVGGINVADVGEVEVSLYFVYDRQGMLIRDYPPISSNGNETCWGAIRAAREAES